MIPAQIIDPVTPSIISMSNSILNASTESATKECDATIDDFSSFVDNLVNMTQFIVIVLHCIMLKKKCYLVCTPVENNATAHHALVNLDREEISCRMPKL